MQLVGAPQVFIRGPFVMEGVLQGGVGALVRAGGARRRRSSPLRARYLVPLAVGDQPVVGIRFLPARTVRLCWSLGGMLVGCLGGLVAAWNSR